MAPHNEIHISRDFLDAKALEDGASPACNRIPLQS
jgi:hypothetical protein